MQATSDIGDRPRQARPEAPSDAPTNRRLQLAGGMALTLRVAGSQDEPLAGALERRLSPRARRLRFEGRAPTLRAPTLRQFAERGGRHLALLALCHDHRGEQDAGEARLVVDPDGRNAEFALSVVDALRRQGLGRQMLLALIVAAGQRDVQWLRGETDDDNAPMLGLFEERGFMPVRQDETRGQMAFERRVTSLLAPA